MTDQSWCLSGELTLEKAQKLEALLDEITEAYEGFPPTLSYFEQDTTPLWRVEVFFPTAPDYALINTLLISSNLEDWDHTITPVEDKDWVSESQRLLSPVEAGAFFVFGSHDADKAMDGKFNLQIEAGQAFGTGKHETTAACLEALTDLRHKLTPHSVLDLGTGSGVLALAAHKLWPQALVTASDIDPIAIAVCEENIVVNRSTQRGTGENISGIKLIVADGLNDPEFQEDKPFNLIVANILAGPLVDMAGDISAALATNGTLILSGLLCTQKKEVLEAYQARGLVTQGRVEKGDWLALVLSKP